MNYRFIIFLLATTVALFFSIPSFLQTDSGKKISLGLDLQGGIYLRLGVEVEQAVVSKYKSIGASIKYFADKNDILIDSLDIRSEKVTFMVLDADDSKKIDKMLSEIKGLKISKNDSMQYSIVLDDAEIIATKEFAVSQAVETIRNRLDQFGLAEPSVVRQGSTDIVVELPGIKTIEDEKRARELIAKPANLELMAIDEEKADQVLTISPDVAKSYGDIILEGAVKSNEKYLVKSIPILDGSQVSNAQVAFDQSNQPIINFALNSQGAQIFGDFTSKNVGKRLAVVLDGKVYSAPVIHERIGGGSGQISGGFSVQEAGNVAIALRSGALLAPVKLLEKRSVGPSLGADSINASLLALLSGFGLVIVFMIVYYGYSGVIASIAVVSNIFIIIAVMAAFGATLTLPGMAGLVLTIGIAVDSNIIILERIRDLLHQGLAVKKALADGYDKAMRAILDSNVTQVLACTILYAYGTGAIKGFAITLSIGILASMLTAILGTYGIYLSLLPKIEKHKRYGRWFGMGGTK